MNVPGRELALSSMTLRGVGSYFYGQRLDLRPLTIICGENGSGKSTWLKAWNLLKNSQRLREFPFAFASDAASFWHDYTNSYLKTFPDHCEQDPHADIEYGPYGTIGLHFEAVDELVLNQDILDGSDVTAENDSLPRTFLLGGRCPKGTRFRIRLAHPVVHDSSDDYSPRPHDLVELQLNGAHAVTFRKDHSSTRYTFTCSGAFLPNTEADAQRTEKVAEYGVGEDKTYPPNGKAAFEQGDLLCRAALLRVRQLLERLLRGVFYISAIRVIETRSEISDDTGGDGQAAVQNRYVGPQGQWTWDLERAFAYNLMRQAPHLGTEPAAWDFTVEQVRGGYEVWDAIRSGAHAAHPTPMKRIWELASEEARESAASAAEMFDSVNNEVAAHLDDPDGRREALNDAKQRVAAAVASLLNGLLDLRALYNPDLWPEVDGETRTLVQRGAEQLPGAELRRLNRRLVEAAFNEGRIGTGLIERAPCFRLEMYVSYWLTRLVQTRILLQTEESPSLGDYWTNDGAPPAGFLDCPVPNPGPEPDVVRDGVPSWDASDLNRFLHICFGKPGSSPHPSPPHFLSAGFHQVAPVVVQAALLGRHEILAVENPEVHLHPSLQLKLTEYLVREAKAGKVIVVETHSDLVVRRVLRAVLAEELPQAQLAIYFASLDDRDKDGSFPFPYSTLRRLQIDDRGQVSNWPKGFMDDDVREARRLLDAMYGPEPENDDREGNPDGE